MKPQYTKEPGYIYIETEEDRKKHAPMLDGDEFLGGSGRWYMSLTPELGFCRNGYVYRRRVNMVSHSEPLPDPWTPCDANTVLPDGVNDDNSWVEVVNWEGDRDIEKPSLFGFGVGAFTHYRIIPKVAPPATATQQSCSQAGNSQADNRVTDAYYAWVSGNECTSDEPMDAWVAGVQWAREHAGDQQ